MCFDSSVEVLDLATGEEGLAYGYPSPEELWAETFSEQNAWRERFGVVPFEDKGGFWEPRYYQHNAINQALESVANGDDRILLTLATGTGKTAIGFQITYDVLAYIAFDRPPVTRAERVDSHSEDIFRQCDYRQQEFLKFVLDHYVQRGVGELDPDKLPQLIELKYHTVRDAISELGPVANIRNLFVEFQRNLY